MSKKLRVFLIVLLILLFTSCVAVVGGYIYFQSKIRSINEEKTLENKIVMIRIYNNLKENRPS